MTDEDTGDVETETEDDESRTEVHEPQTENNEPQTEDQELHANGENPVINEQRDFDRGGEVWRNRGFNFGVDPAESQETNNAWHCEHDLGPHTVDYRKVLMSFPAQMECSRCFAGVCVTVCKEEDDEMEGTESPGKSEAMARLSLAWICYYCDTVYCEKCKSVLEREREQQISLDRLRYSGVGAVVM